MIRPVTDGRLLPRSDRASGVLVVSASEDPIRLGRHSRRVYDESHARHGLPGSCYVQRRTGAPDCAAARAERRRALGAVARRAGGGTPPQHRPSVPRRSHGRRGRAVSCDAACRRPCPRDRMPGRQRGRMGSLRPRLPSGVVRRRTQRGRRRLPRSGRFPLRRTLRRVQRRRGADLPARVVPRAQPPRHLGPLRAGSASHRRAPRCLPHGSVGQRRRERHSRAGTWVRVDA